MTYKRMLLNSLVCLAYVPGLSATALTINLWLGFERNLGGNLAAVVITALLLGRWSGSSLAGNVWLTLYFSILGGIGAVLFLILLAGLSPFGAYSVDPLSAGEAALVFSVNALVFFVTLWVKVRQGSTT
jgi:hypothetical protein